MMLKFESDTKLLNNKKDENQDKNEKAEDDITFLKTINYITFFVRPCSRLGC